MAKHTNVIKSIAEELSAQGKTADFNALGKVFNDLGIKTSDGSNYTGSRGTAKIVNDTYKDLTEQGDYDGAAKVAKTFTNKNGNHSWEK